MGSQEEARGCARGGDRTGEVRFVGEVENSPAAIERTIKKLGKKYNRLHVCFEAGPTGYGLCRQVRDLGHDCMVVAPALIPKRSGERVKTNRRDAVTLARLHRAGELTGVPRSIQPAAQCRGWGRGGELPSLVMWPRQPARRPPSRPRKAPRRRHGRRYPARG